MARYSRKSTSRTRRSSYRSTGRKSTRSARSYSAPRRKSRASSPRRYSSRGRSGGQTIRIVLEQPGAMGSAGAVPANISQALRLLSGDRASASARTKANKPKN